MSVPAEDHLARRRRHAAADDVEQGGLARPVRAAQPEQAALGERERDVVQHAEAAVLLEDAPHLEQRRVRGAAGPRRRARALPLSARRWPASRPARSAGGGRPAPGAAGRRAAPAARPRRPAPRPRRPARTSGAATRSPVWHDAGQPLRVHQQHHGEQHALDDEDVDAHPVARALQVLDDQRADDRADDRAPPADEQHDQQGQLGRRVDHGLRHELLGARVDHAAQGGAHAAEHEQLELAARRADPERGRGPLVDAEHEQLEADVGGQDPGRDEHHRREQHDDDEAAAQRDQRGRSRARPQRAAQRGADRAAEEAGAGHVAHRDQRQHQRGHGQRETGGAGDHRAEQQRDQRRRDHHDHPGQQHRDVVVGVQHGHAVGADAEEHRLGERDLLAEPDLHRHARGDDRVAGRQHEHRPGVQQPVVEHDDRADHQDDRRRHPAARHPPRGPGRGDRRAPLEGPRGRGQELVHPLTADSKPRARGQARIAAARIAYSTVSPYCALT